MSDKGGIGQAFDFTAYKRLYDIWTRSFTEMFDEMLKTPAFAATMGHALDQSVEFKKYFDEAIEETLKQMRLPTAADTKELHRQLNGLVVQLDRLETRLDRLEESLKRRAS